MFTRITPMFLVPSMDMARAGARGTSPKDRILRIFASKWIQICGITCSVRPRNNLHSQNRILPDVRRHQAHVTEALHRSASRMTDLKLLRVRRQLGRIYQCTQTNNRRWRWSLAVPSAGGLRITFVISRSLQSSSGMDMHTRLHWETSLWT